MAEAAPAEEHFIYLVLYQFKSRPVTARGVESGEEVEDEGVAGKGKRKRASTKKYRDFNENFQDSTSPRELRLKIPFNHFFDNLTTNPLGWMAHVGRCILGVPGKVLDPSPGRAEWRSGTRFIFIPDNPFDDEYTRLTKAADIAAITHRTQSVTQTSVRGDFARKLKARDGGCVFTDISTLTVGAHLIPYARQDIWLKQINELRHTNVLDINSPRNGLTLYTGLHLAIDQRKAAILNLPSPELDITDVAEDETDKRSGRKRPKKRRIVFQWLASQFEETIRLTVPYNRNAIFKKLSPLPSPEFLDYIYGASVFKAMGEITEGFHWYERLQKPRRPRTKPPKERRFNLRTSEQSSHKHHKRGSDDSADEGPSVGGSGAGHGGFSGQEQKRGTREGGKGVGRAGRAVKGGHKKAQGYRPRGHAQGLDSDRGRKLTDDDVSRWMAVFRVDDDMIRKFKEEKEHRAPHNIRKWSSQVSTGTPA